MPADGNEAIQGLCKMLAGLLLASGQHKALLHLPKPIESGSYAIV